MRRFTLGLLLLSLIVWTAPATGSSYTYNLDWVFSGNTPGGTSPYLTLTIQDVNGSPLTRGVRFTFSTSGLTGSEFVTEWDFDVNTFPGGFDASDFQLKSGTAATIQVGAGCCKADGDGWHDIKFGFPTSGDRFGPGETTVYFLPDSIGLNASNFNDLGTSSPNGRYYTAAHIQGIGTNGQCSGWIGAGGTDGGGTDGSCGTTTRVPEPSTLLLLGGGLIALSLFARSRLGHH